MSRRLDFNKAFRNEQARYGLSVKDETEWMENDAAARWLARNANRASHNPDYHPSPKRHIACDMKMHRRRRPKHTHADLDPRDPHDQLAGVDMKQLPWK
jgi:hypothetical protein